MFGLCCGGETRFHLHPWRVFQGYRILERAIEEARVKNFLGDNILGTDFSCDIIVHRGAGAYICGEETGLIESLEGNRANPRIKAFIFRRHWVCINALPLLIMWRRSVM